ncbi:agmatine deiminase [Prosthecomicrobium pneumaticum]|uniref:Putative agmatine deiminase n=1 Tax=Prosthecomicrobium pneumaticum TaxID=81895 RepID=A0A7W9L391_9HYPH|nr:agmatine deiminase [Prosthecomicrobium pneumaticum]MBB5754280.1 agmatine deiminase [Prosthecomicrobium pneumaticum]
MTDPLASTPAEDGFAMPAEGAPHRGCFMIWPERPDNWRLGAGPARAAFAAVAHAIAETEPVTMIVSAAARESARALLSPAIRLVEAATDDAWCRDTGPTFVTDAAGRLRGVDWRFNAWGGFDGGLYAPWAQDDRLAEIILAGEDVPRYRAGFVLEGGAIHVDGDGTALVTEACLLSNNRNPGMDRAAIETALRAYLGVSTVIWLGAGVVEDETGGHVDNLACFARPGLVVLAGCDDPADPQYEVTHDAKARLAAARDARGRPIEVATLPMPGPLFMTAEEASGLDASNGAGMARGAGQRLAASYVNHYLANGRVVMPLLDPATDEDAAALLARLHPDRRVAGIPAREILLGGGNIHCITQQMPAGTPG